MTEETKYQVGDEFRFSAAYIERFGYPKKAHYQIKSIEEIPDLGGVFVHCIDINETRAAFRQLPPIVYSFGDLHTDAVMPNWVEWTKLGGKPFEAPQEIDAVITESPRKKLLSAEAPVPTYDVGFGFDDGGPEAVITMVGE